MNFLPVTNNSSKLKSGQAPRHNSGQAMLLTVLALGGTILGATTIAGLLMLYQIRQTTDMANSAKAIYAADAGVEVGLYNFFCVPQSGGCQLPQNYPRFSNGAALSLICFDDNDRSRQEPRVDCYTAAGLASTTSMRSIGQSGDSARAFLLTLQSP